MKEYNVTKDDAANLVNSLDSIKGSLIWVAFIEQDDEVEIRVRLRSRFVAINDIARNYRGGGHLQAAGATLYSKDEMDSILNELDLLHKEFKENNKELF
jgi:phosphoesterase RecJ-like protein